MQTADRHFPIQTYNWWIENCYILVISLLTDASLLALTAQAAQETQGSHVAQLNRNMPKHTSSSCARAKKVYGTERSH